MIKECNMFVWATIVNNGALIEWRNLEIDDIYIKYLDKYYCFNAHTAITEEVNAISTEHWCAIYDTNSYTKVTRFIINISLNNNNYDLIKGLKLKLLK